ncbi:MAG: energy transducer TonB [Alphaproteobacteria bacterium]|nr:energy transducer TonB [Alphaproteobacteria bacterium]
MRELVFGLLGLLACVAVDARAQEARGPVPRDIETWAMKIQEDYPVSALADSEEGTVAMELKIDEAGSVLSCEVTKSSRSFALDDAACRGMIEYAQYDPAVDSEGNPQAATTVQAIRYVLPDMAMRHTHPVPIDEAIWRSTAFDASFDRGLRRSGADFASFQLVIDEDGKPVGCGMNHSTGNAALDRRGCEALLRLATFEPAALLDGTPIPGSYWISHAAQEAP